MDKRKRKRPNPAITLFNLIAQEWGQYQFLEKIETHLPHFHLLSLPLSNDQLSIFAPTPFYYNPLPAHFTPFNQAHLLLEK